MKAKKNLTSSGPRLPASLAGKVALLTLGLIVLLLLFSPGAMTIVWHLRDGHSVTYRGRTIPVPIGWVAKVEPQGAQLTRRPWTLLSKRSLVGWISFNPSHFDQTKGRDDLTKSWEALYWTGLAQTDNVVSGPLKVGSGANGATCFISSSKRNSDLASADCLMFEPAMGAHFSGDKSDIEIFFQIVRAMN
jgi:hypothetical protein